MTSAVTPKIHAERGNLTVVVPRRTGTYVPKAVFLSVSVAFHLVAQRSRSYPVRDRLLAYQAPVALLALLTVWIAFLLCGFTLVFWPFIPGHHVNTSALASAFTLSGSSLFTLGFSASSSAVPLVTFMAAGCGLTVLALEIGYLPVIYGAFNRRETLVTLLDSRSGSPPWGPEILARHELVDNVENLRYLYQRWEEWAADVAETHTTYPPLVFFRSPAANRSWVVGMLAVLDAAALHLATKPLSAPPDARPFIRMGYVMLRDVSRLFHLPVNDDPKPEDPISLTREEFEFAIHHLEHAGWEMELDSDEAWIQFKGWRVTYESLAYRLANLTDATPAYWGGPRERLPAALSPPPRPPHRRPSKQIDSLREVTRQRRLARGIKDDGPLHGDEHDADATAEEQPPTAGTVSPDPEGAPPHQA